LPSLQDGDCAGTLRTWRRGFTLDVSIPLLKGYSVLQSMGFTHDISLSSVNGFSVLQSTGSTLDVSLLFIGKHDLKANNQEIANIPVVRVMANTRNRFIQCMVNGDVTYPM